MARVAWRQRYRDSRAIMGASLRSLATQRDLWRFPVAAGLVLMVSMAGAFALAYFLMALHPAASLAVIMVVMVPIGVVAAMLQTAMAHCLLERWQGNPCNPAQGWRAARSRFGLIVRFTIVSSLVAGLFAVVGQLLDKARLVPGLGRILQLVGAFGWATAAFFVIPAIAAGSATSVTGALKESVGLARQQWGKSVSGIVTISLVLMVPLMVVLVPAVLLGPMLIFAGAPFWLVMTLMMAPFVLFMLVGVPLQNAALTVYSAALYRFATHGELVDGFDGATLVDPWQAYQA